MSLQQSGTTDANSLRPRNRRLISIEDDLNSQSRNDQFNFSDATASTTSSSTVRAPSPLPSAHPSRSSSSQRHATQPTTRSWGFQAPSSVNSNSLFKPGAWETSWSSIQGLASTLLGNDIRSSSKGEIAPKRKPGESHKSRYSIATPESWGPSAAEQSFASGSQEDRLAQVQAKKREKLLLANGHSSPDSLGKHKRRTSLGTDVPAWNVDTQSDTRAYVHKVQKGDTLAGLSIRYKCPQMVLQKANRLWSNDSIHVKSVLYVPVDACEIRGRRITSPKASLDLIREFSSKNPEATTTQTEPDYSINQNPTTTVEASKSPSSSMDMRSVAPSKSKLPVIHDSWISVEHIPHPVEIVKLPQQLLGSFPPARRKSIDYSDTTPPLSPNTSSPSTHSPNERGRARSPHTRQRGTSSASASAAYYLKRLRGPGGVGSLNSKTHSPGPPRDKLNELFTQHFPGISLTAPRSSFESTTSASSAATGLNELGGKVEGWVRKIAMIKKDRQRTEGDVIELVEGWDSGVSDIAPGGDSGASGVERRTNKPAISVTREEEERLLSERFPVRGRVFEEQSRR